MLQSAACQTWTLILRLIFFSFLFVATLSAADEEILSFNSDILVNPDSSILVTETIQVNALGNKIKRGIYRDFPVATKNSWGLSKKVGFDVLAVSRNGLPENYVLENITGGLGQANGKRIRIGNKNTFIEHGIHTYVITYRTTHQLGYFDEYDELYWNVTGNGWDFTIRKATATVRLPADVYTGDIQFTSYAGPEGSTSTKNSIAIINSSEGTYYSESTKPLYSGHGLTIALGWPKGLVKEPTSAEIRDKLIKDNLGAIIGLLGTLLVFIYYFLSWNAVGRDPREGIIIPRYEAPEGLSPAEVRYLDRMAFDKKAFTAEVLGLATMGKLTIVQDPGDSKYRLVKNEQAEASLTNVQESLVSSLFGSGISVSLTKANYQKIQNAISVLKYHLKSKFFQKYFFKNRKYLVIGALLSVIPVLIAAAMESVEMLGVLAFFSVWLSGWTFGVYFMVAQSLTLWRSVTTNKANTIAALGVSLFAAPFLIAEIVVLGVVYSMVSFLLFVIIVLAIGQTILFAKLLKAPTKIGQRARDQIKGFKLYLSVGEKDILSRYRGPGSTPERTIEEYEKFLPYALALDVEQEWSEKFADVIQAASLGSDGTTNYSPTFFQGRSFSSPSNLAAGVGTAFSSAIASASTPKSSGGSGGGGFSGGGGW